MNFDPVFTMVDRVCLIGFIAFLSTCTATYVHEHVVHAALSSSFPTVALATPPTLPDSFRSFGDFSFIETFEEPDEKSAQATDTEEKATKPIPKKLKCSCEFQKVEAESNAVGLTAPASLLEKQMLRSA